MLVAKKIGLLRKAAKVLPSLKMAGGIGIYKYTDVKGKPRLEISQEAIEKMMEIEWIEEKMRMRNGLKMPKCLIVIEFAFEIHFTVDKKKLKILWIISTQLIFYIFRPAL